MNKKFFFSGIIFIGLTFLIYYILFRKFSNSTFIFPGLRPGELINYCAILFLLFILYFGFDGLRLYFIIRAMGKTIKLPVMLKLIFSNILVSNITPSAAGGGFVQIYFLTKSKISIGEATAITSIRTVIAMFFFIVFTPVILLFDKAIDKILPVKTVFFYAGAFMLIYVSVFYLIIKKSRLIKRIVLSILVGLRKWKLLSPAHYRKSRYFLIREISNLSLSFKKFFKAPVLTVILSFLSTAVFLISLFSFTPFLFSLFHLKYNFTQTIFLQLIITFTMYFMPTPGSSGIAEAGYAFLFSKFVSLDLIPTITFLWRFLTIYIGMIPGAFILFYEFVLKKAKKQKIKQ